MITSPIEPHPTGPVGPATRVASWLWSLVPLITLGAGTWATFWYAAYRRRSRLLWLVGVVYLAALVSSIVVNAQVNGASGSHTWPVLPMVLLAGIGGTVHAFSIRGAVFAPRALRPARPPREAGSPPRLPQPIGRSGSTTRNTYKASPPTSRPVTEVQLAGAVADEERAQAALRTQRHRKARAEHWNAVIILTFMGCAALAIAGGCGYLLYRANHDGSAMTDNAINACEHFVSQDLKSPSTARFPLYDDDQVSNIGNVYTVTSYVDSENSFGAKLRTDYQCTVQWHPEKNAWALVGISGVH